MLSMSRILFNFAAANTTSLVSFDEKGDYDQKDAEGFIKVNALRLKNILK